MKKRLYLFLILFFIICSVFIYAQIKPSGNPPSPWWSPRPITAQGYINAICSSGTTSYQAWCSWLRSHPNDVPPSYYSTTSSTCTVNGGYCSTDSQCCSHTCTNGYCSPGQTNCGTCPSGTFCYGNVCSSCSSLYACLKNDGTRINCGPSRCETNTALTTCGTCSSGQTCSNGQCITQTLTPSVRIISPNGGEKWQIGSSYIIQWSTQNIPLDAKINLEIYEEGTDREFATAIYHGLTASVTSYNWLITTFPVPNKNYWVLIKIVGSNGLYLASDISDAPFSIITQQSQCKSNGSSCSSTGIACCNGNCCGGVCRSLKSAGEICELNCVCSSGLCYNGKCTATTNMMISGYVKTSNGNPINGVTIQAQYGCSGSGGSSTSPTSTTNSNGYYNITTSNWGTCNSAYLYVSKSGCTFTPNNVYVTGNVVIKNIRGDCSSQSGLNEDQLIFCEAANDGNNCDMLQSLGIVTKEQCCSNLNLCCSSSNIVSTTEFKVVFINAIRDYLAHPNSAKLNWNEIKDLALVYLSITSNTTQVDLSGIGNYSQERLIDIYNKAKN
ncbi:MAG: hypothetical protein V1815_02920 [Candidatus Woesearchaeota archaeon]